MTPTVRDYVNQSHYLKWDRDVHYIALETSYDEFENLEPVMSDKHGSDQFEVPIRWWNDNTLKTGSNVSVLGTKSKVLLAKLLDEWVEDNYVLRVSKSGTGFYTKWETSKTDYVYDKASSKIRKKSKKKS
jgi:hypothetical protein